MARQQPRTGESPRERFITVYGRKPVQEVLLDRSLRIDKLVIADNVSRRSVAHLVELAHSRGIRIEDASPQWVKRLAGNGKQDQGVVADVVSPGLRSLESYAAELGRSRAAARIVVLDGVNNPANVGMIIRTATAAGFDAIVLPSAGSPGVGPLVIKASAGIALTAPIVRCRHAVDAVKAFADAGCAVVGLDPHAPASLYDTELPDRVALVLGGETDGLSPEVAHLVDTAVSIPMAGGVESLNVAAGAAVVTFEIARRGR